MQRITTPRNYILSNLFFFFQKALFLAIHFPETFHLKLGRNAPKRKGSYSNHPFSGANCNSVSFRGRNSNSGIFPLKRHTILLLTFWEIRDHPVKNTTSPKVVLPQPAASHRPLRETEKTKKIPKLPRGVRFGFVGSLGFKV